MRKVLSLLMLGALVSAFPVGLLAETDPFATREIDDIQRGVNNGNAIVDLLVKDDATIFGDAEVRGAVNVVGATTVSNTFRATGAILTLGATQLVFTASGTNNAAIAAPTNMVSGDGIGIGVRVNGTNYILRATLN